MTVCKHTVGLTCGQSITCFYMIELGIKFTMREDTTDNSANSYVDCHYDIYQDTFSSYLRHTVSIGNRFPWLYINYFQSPWFWCIIIESGIFLWWVSRGGRGCMFLKKGEISRRGNEKKKGRVFQIVVRDGRKSPTEGGTGSRILLWGDFYWVKGTWGGVILMIQTFFKAKNSFLWMLNIN